MYVGPILRNERGVEPRQRLFVWRTKIVESERLQRIQHFFVRSEVLRIGFQKNERGNEGITSLELCKYNIRFDQGSMRYWIVYVKFCGNSCLALLVYVFFGFELFRPRGRKCRSGS